MFSGSELKSPLIALFAAPFIGSFLGVLIHRLPKGEPVLVARSRCRICGHKLRPWELVPVLSFASSFGRCRQCGVPIGFFHPAIELAAIAVPAWTALSLPGKLLWPSCYLGWSLLALGVIDYRHFLLPDLLTYPLLGVGLVLAALAGPDRLLQSALGAGSGFAAFAFIGFAYRQLRGRSGLGLGDAKLLAALGAWMTWVGLPLVVLIGSWAALIFALTQFLRSVHLDPSTKVPLDAFLALGGWLVWLYGPRGRTSRAASSRPA